MQATVLYYGAAWELRRRFIAPPKVVLDKPSGACYDRPVIWRNTMQIRCVTTYVVEYYYPEAG